MPPLIGAAIAAAVPALGATVPIIGSVANLLGSKCARAVSGSIALLVRRS
jgi:hypothetical protein